MKFILAILALSNSYFAIGQGNAPVYTIHTTAENRLSTHRNIINNSITKNLSLPLTTETEENWEDAFHAMALINYRTLWIDNRIQLAFDSIQNRSEEFRRSLIEMAFIVYPKKFMTEIENIGSITKSAKVFTMSTLFVRKQDTINQLTLVPPLYIFDGNREKNQVFLDMVFQEEKDKSISNIAALIRNSIAAAYLPANMVIYSFQRKNRNYPGLVMVRDKGGSFIRNANGNIFSVQQLARSVSNLPFYLTNGNTPQGIYRVTGFDVSKSIAIGPTTNIQLMMPYETTPQLFLKDTSITDTVWNETLYKTVLPEGFKEEKAMYQTYFASKIGRTEIIAHGTTVDPEFYRNQPFYPHTPTQGCLCTKEIWDATGKRVVSDQQSLIDAVKKTGSTDGYLVVIEIDDQQKAVSLEEILALAGLNK